MTELLDKKHHREDFDCGKDIKRKLSVCFVLSENETSIQGYYIFKRNFQNHTTLFQRLYLED
jgi:hypothetical protein